MRSAVRPMITALALLFATLPALAQVGAPAQRKGVSITPYIGVLVPTADLFSYQNGTAT